VYRLASVGADCCLCLWDFVIADEYIPPSPTATRPGHMRCVAALDGAPARLLRQRAASACVSQGLRATEQGRTALLANTGMLVAMLRVAKMLPTVLQLLSVQTASNVQALSKLCNVGVTLVCCTGWTVRAQGLCRTAHAFRSSLVV
jgi:hypothetical protein